MRVRAIDAGAPEKIQTFTPTFGAARAACVWVLLVLGFVANGCKAGECTRCLPGDYQSGSSSCGQCKSCSELATDGASPAQKSMCAGYPLRVDAAIVDTSPADGHALDATNEHD